MKPETCRRLASPVSVDRNSDLPCNRVLLHIILNRLRQYSESRQGTRQGCSVSRTEFNLYAERIMRTVWRGWWI